MTTIISRAAPCQFALLALTLLMGVCPRYAFGEPQLRLEAGMHTAKISRISSDAEGRLLLTVSEDKTARLWELPTGRLLRVLRPPFEDRQDGNLFACSLSPDGTIAAVAGFTGKSGEKKRIYLFDTASGEITRCLEDLPQSVDALAFSEGGRWLASGIRDHGIFIWDTRTWKQVAADTQDTGVAYPRPGSQLRMPSQSFHFPNLIWRGDHRLASVWNSNHEAGTLKVYTWEQRPPRQLSPEGSLDALMPGAAGISPDGHFYTLACGRGVRGEKGAVLVVNWNGPDVENDQVISLTPGHPMNRVAWSSKDTIVAGGEITPESKRNVLHIWEAGGRGNARTVEAGHDLITDLCALPDGSVAFATRDPLWGILQPSDEVTITGIPSIIDYRGPADSFRVSADGYTVGVGFADGSQPFLMNARQRQVRELHGALPVPELFVMGKTGLRSMQGYAFRKSPTEQSWSEVWTKDRSLHYLGSSFFLRRVNRKGNVDWAIPTPALTAAVKLSQDERTVIAAFRDGTIRWYRAEDGEEFLACFLHADGRRWILWTPEGYYDCSPGGEDFIGWHINRRSCQAADFFPASSFRAVFYRPDVIHRVLQTRDTAQAVSAANTALGRPQSSMQDIREVLAHLSPPVLELETGGVLGRMKLEPHESAVKVTYRVRQTGSTIPVQVKARFNGRPLRVELPLPPPGESVSTVIPLPTGLSGTLALFAEGMTSDGGRNTSTAALLQVESADTPAQTSSELPRLLLINIGVGFNAQAKLPKLPHAADSAKKLQEILQQVAPSQHREVIPLALLLDENATTHAIREVLDRAARESRPQDCVFIFFSGHGLTEPSSGYQLITADADPSQLDDRTLSGREFIERLERIPARTVLALETCHAAAITGTGNPDPEYLKQTAITHVTDLTGMINELSSMEQGTVILSSSASDEFSWGLSGNPEGELQPGGIFSQALREGLQGRAANATQVVTCASLQGWTLQRVPVLNEMLVDVRKNAGLITESTPVEVLNALRQTPVCILPPGVPDFPLVLATP